MKDFFQYLGSQRSLNDMVGNVNRYEKEANKRPKREVYVEAWAIISILYMRLKCGKFI
jgi:hypothetical protein